MIKPYREDKSGTKHYLRRWSVKDENYSIRLVTIVIAEFPTNAGYKKQINYYAGTTILNPTDEYNKEREMKIVEGRITKAMGIVETKKDHYLYCNREFPIATISPGMKCQRLLEQFFQRILSNICRETIHKLADVKGRLSVQEIDGEMVVDLLNQYQEAEGTL